METGNFSQDIVSTENKSDLKVHDYNDASDSVRSSPDNDCDTDSTIVYALDVKDEKFDVALDSPTPEETYISTIKSVSSDVRPFSPLPSTSSDNITIDLNNTRFNEASRLSTCSPNSPEYLSTTNLPHQPGDVIECSSGSGESDSEPIVIREKKKRPKRKKNSFPDVIDLLLDDVDTRIYDSDCEIIDVDLLIAQNNAVLNSHQPQEVIQLDDPVPEPSAHSTTEVEHSTTGAEHSTTEVEHSTPITSSDGLYTSPLMKHLSSFVKMRIQVKDFFDKHLPLFTSKDENKDLPILSDSVLNVMSSMIKIPFNYETRKGRKRERKDKNPKNKRARVLETIDLDLIRNPIQQQSSEVIVIDSDTSINAGRHSNADSPFVSNLYPHSGHPNVQSPKRRRTRPGRSQHSAECRGCEECCVPWYGYEGHNALLGSNRSSIPQIMPSMEVISPGTSLFNVMSSLSASPLQPPSVASLPMTPSKNYGECPVCLECLQKGNAVSTFCGHIFCETCIKKVKLTSKKCPTCRKALRGKGYHQIFL